MIDGVLNTYLQEKTLTIKADRFFVTNPSGEPGLSLSGSTFTIGKNWNMVRGEANCLYLESRDGIKINKIDGSEPLTKATAIISLSEGGSYGPILSITLSSTSTTVSIDSNGLSVNAITTSLIGKDLNSLCSLPNRDGTIALKEDIVGSGITASLSSDGVLRLYGV